MIRSCWRPDGIDPPDLPAINLDNNIALASSGGIPVVGVTQGSRISAVQMEHVWVEAALDYQPSRGARNIEPDSWVAMDPSFKRYEFLEGLDPIEIAGLDTEAPADDFVASGTVNEDESWVTGFDPQILEDAQQQLQDALEQFIEDNLNDPTVGDVIGGRKVIVQEFPEVPGNLPNRVLVDGEHLDTQRSGWTSGMCASRHEGIGKQLSIRGFRTFPAPMMHEFSRPGKRRHAPLEGVFVSGCAGWLVWLESRVGGSDGLPALLPHRRRGPARFVGADDASGAGARFTRALRKQRE